MGPKTDQNLSKIDAKMHSNCASVFGSIFELFLIDFWGHLGTIFRSCWASSGGSATWQKNSNKQIMVFNDFSRFRGSKLASFSYVFGVSVSRSFFDRLGVGFGVDLGAVWAPKWGLC